MNKTDIILIALIALAVVFAVIMRVRAKKRGTGCCSCGCPECNGCPPRNKKKKD